MLVENYLWAVVSLPAGVFNPYSGVKTSILLLDRNLARRTEEVLFVKINNDGFDLGAQRRPIDNNDLPAALRILLEHKGAQTAQESDIALCVNRKRLLESGDCNLSGDRYRAAVRRFDSNWPLIRLADVCSFISDGDWVETKDQADCGIRLVQTGNVGMGEYADKGEKARFITESKFKELNCTEVYPGDILVSRLPDPVGRACKMPLLPTRMITAVDCTILRFDPSKMISDLFVFYTLSSHYYENLSAFLTGASRQRISRRNLEEVEIPLPPLDEQELIVAELEGYRKIIEGARQVLANYKPAIEIHPKWPMVQVGEVVHFVSGLTLAIPDHEAPNGVPIVSINNISEEGELLLDNVRTIKLPENTKANFLEKGDLLFNWRNGSTRLVGKTGLWDIDGKYVFASFLLGVRPQSASVDPRYLWTLLNTYRKEGRYQQWMRRNVNGLFNREELRLVTIPLPPLDIQRRIVAEIEAERVLVGSNRKLIEIFEAKIKAKLDEIWGTSAEESGARESPISQSEPGMVLSEPRGVGLADSSSSG